MFFLEKLFLEKRRQKQIKRRQKQIKSYIKLWLYFYPSTIIITIIWNTFPHSKI